MDEISYSYLKFLVLIRKKSISPPHLCKVEPLTYETVYITLWTFQNQPNYPQKQFRKIILNHKKNHKKYNCVGLQMSRSTQLTYNIVCFSIFFYSYEEKHRSKATAKKYTKTYHIIYSLCRSTHLESNTIRFFIYDFSVIYYDFSKLF